LTETDPNRGPLARTFARYVALAERRSGLLLALLFGLFVTALWPALHLELHTDMAELLPDNHPAVLALRRIAGRQRSSTNLVILIESPSAEANRQFSDALRPSLEAMVPSVFSEIQWKPETDVAEYAARWKWLYAEKGDLEHAEELLDRLVARRGSPLSVDLDEGDPEAELRSLRKRLDAKLPARSASDRFEGAETGAHYLGIMLWRSGGGLAALDDQATLDRVQAAIAQVGLARFHPQMKVEYTGAIAMALDEHAAIRDDLTLATALCTTLVLLVIWLYFRRLALLWVIGSPAVLGLMIALALARLTIHYLNANTAFLISIILGNGINSPIILLARFGEERRAGAAVGPALARAMCGTLLATGTAVAAASIAYGSLLATSFRGFSQFGLVGGAGMLLVWLATFALVPPMVIFGERLRPGLLTPRQSWFRRPFAALGRTGARRPLVFVCAAAALLAGAALPLARWLRDPMEWNFGNLRSAETRAQKNWVKMYGLGMGNVGAGHIGTDGVLLVDRAEQADPVAEAMRAQDASFGAERLLKEVRTVHSILPADQDEKLQLLARLRRKIDRHQSLMSDDERAEAMRFRPPDDLHAIGVPDLPRSLREAFTETDGQIGRMIGIDGDPSKFSDWNGHDLLRLQRSMRVEALGRTWVAASTSTIFAGMLEAMHRDGPLVSWIALGGVLGLIALAFGPRSAVPVVVSLAIGMVWLGGLLALIKLKLNFINFVAVPITLGVGTDYAANIWARLRHDPDARQIGELIGEAGSAVALCSATTIIGYSSLLLASNRALKSFGLLADLGEVTCLAAALIALPALVSLAARRRQRVEEPAAGTG
jgi:predicted RND superfamily exporter protein